MLVAPLSGRQCIVWDVIVEEPSERGRLWQRVAEERSHTPFHLRDTTGRAAIVFDGASQLALRVTRYRLGALRSSVPTLEVFLQRHGVAATHAGGLSRTLRAREMIVEAGSLLIASGRAVQEPMSELQLGAMGTYREPPQELVLRGSSRAPLLIADDAERV